MENYKNVVNGGADSNIGEIKSAIKNNLVRASQSGDFHQNQTGTIVGKKPTSEKKHCSDENNHLGTTCLKREEGNKKLKTENRNLGKSTEEKKAFHQEKFKRRSLSSFTNDPVVKSDDSKMNEIQERYSALLPAIALAMQTMRQTAFSRRCPLNDSKNVNRGNAFRNHERIDDSENNIKLLRKCIEEVNEDDRNYGRGLLKQSESLQHHKEHLKKKLSEEDINDESRLAYPKVSSENTIQYINDFREKISPFIRQYEPPIQGLVTGTPNGGNVCSQKLLDTNEVENNDSSFRRYKRKTVHSVSSRNPSKRDLSRQLIPYQVLKKKCRLGRKPVNKHLGAVDHLHKVLHVEQNILYSKPSSKSAIFSPLSSGALIAKVGSSDVPPEQFNTNDCKCKKRISEEQFTSDVIINDYRSVSIKEYPSLEPYYGNQGSVQVQTSFPSFIEPCRPATCPGRVRPSVHNRIVEVQTDGTHLEGHRQSKRSVTPSYRMVPPKRTTTMDDRLLRRIAYFDSQQSSVCNRNVQFCTYTVHLSKKTSPKGSRKIECMDCPGHRKCNIVLQNLPKPLPCNEIAVEVQYLELNQDGVDSLEKVCSFVYIDYVFVGHVGNETNLGPVSHKILFDSRKSYSVSLRFNKKERSILREQFNPSGLLVKDTIMFILVCQASPNHGINKNWDFAFGYLSMKQIGDQLGSNDVSSWPVEMKRICGAKKVGKLLVTIEGLQLIKRIMKEELHCINPRVGAVMKRLCLNKKEIKAAEKKKGKKR